MRGSNVADSVRGALGLIEHAPQLPDTVVKAGLVASPRATQALHAVGSDSGILEFFGHPQLRPIVEASFTQGCQPSGDYIARLEADLRDFFRPRRG